MGEEYARLMIMSKDTRISIRLSKEDKKQFYKICATYGLCPSKLIERWIHRFNLNARRKNISIIQVVWNPHDEAYADYNEYKKSGK